MSVNWLTDNVNKYFLLMQRYRYPSAYKDHLVQMVLALWKYSTEGSGDQSVIMTGI